MNTKSLNFQELKLLTGTPEAVQMLRNKVFVPEALYSDAIDFLDVNAMDLDHYSLSDIGAIFYFLDAQDMINIQTIVSNYNQKS